MRSKSGVAWYGTVVLLVVGRAAAESVLAYLPDLQVVGFSIGGRTVDPTISKEHVLSLLEPYPANLMLSLPASTRANSVRDDDSGLLLPEEPLAA